MNYQLELDKIIDRIRSEENGKIPELLIHSCCILQQLCP